LLLTLFGQVVLIVNVASKCGFASQYAGLEQLYTKYKDNGFEVIGAPCNQFLNQGKLSQLAFYSILVIYFLHFFFFGIEPGSPEGKI
jgi:glutathione peroxidase-family protein